MNRIDDELSYKWHIALNAYNNVGGDFRHWMYEAKNMADEVGRIALWFGRERTGELPKIHKQCSHQEAVPITENHLSCCLGVKCKECPHLLAIDKAEVTPEQLDEIKAWTCCSHILHELGAHPNGIDTSKGYILTVGDRMFWDNVYSSLAGSDKENEPEQGE
jgi:hypothetical protein